MYLGASAPDRLAIASKARAFTERIDQEDYFALGKKASLTRSELYAFVMALGYGRSAQLQLANPYSGGFIQDKSIDGRLLALMCSQFFETLSEDTLDRMTDKAAIYKMAEQYANAGFESLEILAESDLSNEEYMLEQLIDLDSLYNKVQAQLPQVNNY